MIAFALVALAFIVGMAVGFVLAIVCYPDKQEIIDRIKKDAS